MGREIWTGGGGGDNSETGLREIGSDGVRWIEPVHDTVHCSSLVS